jgi:hypothetical protein
MFFSSGLDFVPATNHRQDGKCVWIRVTKVQFQEGLPYIADMRNKQGFAIDRGFHLRVRGGRGLLRTYVTCLISYRPTGSLLYRRPFLVFKNSDKRISSCLRNPLAGKLPLLTISTTAQTEAAVVHEMDRHLRPAISIG